MLVKTMAPSTASYKEAKLLEKVRVKPNEQKRVSLGRYTDVRPPRGFSVAISPDPKPTDSIQTEVSSIGTLKQHNLVLSITNNGPKVVSAEVWEFV